MIRGVIATAPSSRPDRGRDSDLLEFYIKTGKIGIGIGHGPFPTYYGLSLYLKDP